MTLEREKERGKGAYPAGLFSFSIFPIPQERQEIEGEEKRKRRAQGLHERLAAFLLFDSLPSPSNADSEKGKKEKSSMESLPKKRRKKGGDGAGSLNPLYSPFVTLRYRRGRPRLGRGRTSLCSSL